MTTHDSTPSQNLVPTRKVRKAVLPAAGLGTRFLPATKAQPKEMLTVVDKPQIQYVAEECVASGIEHIIIVTGKGKNSIEDHFDSSPILESFLESKGKMEQAEMVRDIGNMLQVSYTRQKEPLGLGHAVVVARDLVGDEPFAVLLADDLMVCEVPCLAQMVEAYDETGGNLAAIIEVPRAHTQRYGVLDVVSDDGRVVRARGVVEKPEPAAAPSTLTIIGRYIIQPEVFAHLGRTEPGSGGEIQLTDALARLIEDGQAFHGLRFTGKRFDCGDKLGFLEATVALGLQHPELGPGLRQILNSYL